MLSIIVPAYNEEQMVSLSRTDDLSAYAAGEYPV